MFKRTISVLLLINLIQFLSSCDTCNCDVTDYYISYTGASVETVDLSGFDESISNIFEKATDLGLLVYLEFNQREIAEKGIDPLVSYSSAFACSCPPPVYEFDDYIENISIYELNSGGRIDISDAFEVPYADETITIDDYLNEFAREPSNYIFEFQIRLKLINENAIGRSPKLRVEVELNSGKILSAETSILTINS